MNKTMMAALIGILTLTGAVCAQSLLGVAGTANGPGVRNEKAKGSPDGRLAFGIEWSGDSGAGITTWVARVPARGFRIKQVEYRWQPLAGEGPGPDPLALKGGVVVKDPANAYGIRIPCPAGWRFEPGVLATERDATATQMGIAARITIVPNDGGEEEVVRIVVRSPAFRAPSVQAAN